MFCIALPVTFCSLLLEVNCINLHVVCINFSFSLPSDDAILIDTFYISGDQIGISTDLIPRLNFQVVTAEVIHTLFTACESGHFELANKEVGNIIVFHRSFLRSSCNLFATPFFFR